MDGTKRLTWITATTLAGLLLATSVAGALANEHPGRGQGQGHGQAAEQHEDGPRGQGLGLLKHQEDAEELEDVTTPLVTDPATPTDVARPERECPDEATEDFEWMNHGHYVSCVAQSYDAEAEDGNRGSVVSEAAQSDIGKDHQDADVDEETHESDGE